MRKHLSGSIAALAVAGTLSLGMTAAIATSPAHADAKDHEGHVHAVVGDHLLGPTRDYNWDYTTELKQTDTFYIMGLGDARNGSKIDVTVGDTTITNNFLKHTDRGKPVQITWTPGCDFKPGTYEVSAREIVTDLTPKTVEYAAGTGTVTIVADPKCEQPKPDNPDNPDKPDNPNPPDKPDNPNPPDKPDNPNKPDNPGTDKPDNPGTDTDKGNNVAAPTKNTTASHHSLASTGSVAGLAGLVAAGLTGTGLLTAATRRKQR